LVRSPLARRGIVVGRMPTANRLDHALVRVLSARSIDYVLDVGAHTGEYGRFLRQECGWAGPICSFEPVHSSFLELTRAIEGDDGWRGYEMALGSKTELTVIRHFPEGSRFDSLLSPTEYGRRRFAALASPFREEPVTVRRLDEVIDEVLPPSPSDRMLLKIDAQGFDLEVLHGAANCLDRIASLQLELPALAIYEGLPDFGNAIGEVMKFGFDPVGFFPVTRDQNLRVIEFDCLFVRI
jgi:FkbM family methyltransferase